MRSNSLKYVIGFGVAALMAWSTPACSSDEDEGGGGKGGTGGGTGAAGGTGGSGTGGSGTGGKGGTGGTGGGGDSGPTTITCGSDTCEGVALPIGGLSIGPCCSADKCGLDTSLLAAAGITFSPACQEKNQPGEADAGCPTFTQSLSGFNIELPGCCRPSGKCGYLVNDPAGGVVVLNLGCVDAQPLLEGGTPDDCTPGAGTGGAGGSAGAPGTGGSAGGDAAAD